MAPGRKRRFLATAMSLAMVSGVSAMAAAPTFAAMPAPPASCNWGDVWYGFGNQAKPYAITHAAGVTIPPHWTYSQTTGLQRTASITAGVTGTVTGTAEANFLIGKVGGSVTLSLQASGTATDSASVSDTWSYTNTTPTTQNFVLYTAPHRVTASWQKWQCDRWGNYSILVSSGSVLSWDIEYKGVSDCSKTYASSTAQYLAKKLYCV
jgi:hypothetical protein